MLCLLPLHTFYHISLEKPIEIGSYSSGVKTIFCPHFDVLLFNIVADDYVYFRVLEDDRTSQIVGSSLSFYYSGSDGTDYCIITIRLTWLWLNCLFFFIWQVSGFT